jgi:DNA topoisomerase-1
MSAADVDLETALRLLSLPRVLGQDENGVDVAITYGRFGAYIKRGEDTRSLENEGELFTFTVEDAMKLLAQPKKGRRRGPQALKTLGEAADLEGATVKLLEGRFGPYVSDGTTNASIPKGADPETVTLEQAVHLIKERMARGPVKKKRGAGKAAKKPSKTTSKRSAKKSSKKSSKKFSKKAAKKETAKTPKKRTTKRSP